MRSSITFTGRPGMPVVMNNPSHHPRSRAARKMRTSSSGLSSVRGISRSRRIGQ